MHRNRWLAFGLALLAICLAAGTAWAALTSASYRLVNNTFEGGAAGSGVSSTSTNYRISAMTFGTTSMFLASSSYQMCAGFPCAEPSRRVFLPLILRQ